MLNKHAKQVGGLTLLYKMLPHSVCTIPTSLQQFMLCKVALIVDHFRGNSVPVCCVWSGKQSCMLS